MSSEDVAATLDAALDIAASGAPPDAGDKPEKKGFFSKLFKK